MLHQTVQRFRATTDGSLGSVASLLQRPPLAAPLLPTNREKIERCVTDLKTHLDEGLYAEQMASIAHISTSHFFVLFRQFVGSAPMEYFVRLRMEHAAQLLRDTNQEVKRIAAAVGYEDPFYFSPQFKLQYQLAPSDYRSREAIKSLVQSSKTLQPPARIKL